MDEAIPPTTTVEEPPLSRWEALKETLDVFAGAMIGIPAYIAMTTPTAPCPECGLPAYEDFPRCSHCGSKLVWVPLEPGDDDDEW